jgi:hypothetical protein
METTNSAAYDVTGVCGACAAMPALIARLYLGVGIAATICDCAFSFPARRFVWRIHKP